jgi:hypothetical protein
MNEGTPSFDQAYHSHGHHAQGGSGGIGLHPSLQHHGPAAANRESGQHTQSDPSFQTHAHHDESLNEATEVHNESLQVSGNDGSNVEEGDRTERDEEAAARAIVALMPSLR